MVFISKSLVAGSGIDAEPISRPSDSGAEAGGGDGGYSGGGYCGGGGGGGSSGGGDGDGDDGFGEEFRQYVEEECYCEVARSRGFRRGYASEGAGHIRAYAHACPKVRMHMACVCAQAHRLRSTTTARGRRGGGRRSRGRRVRGP